MHSSEWQFCCGDVSRRAYCRSPLVGRLGIYHTHIVFGFANCRANIWNGPLKVYANLIQLEVIPSRQIYLADFRSEILDPIFWETGSTI